MQHTQVGIAHFALELTFVRISIMSPAELNGSKESICPLPVCQTVYASFCYSHFSQ